MSIEMGMRLIFVQWTLLLSQGCIFVDSESNAHALLIFYEHWCVMIIQNC